MTLGHCESQSQKGFCPQCRSNQFGAHTVSYHTRPTHPPHTPLLKNTNTSHSKPGMHEFTWFNLEFAKKSRRLNQHTQTGFIEEKQISIEEKNEHGKSASVQEVKITLIMLVHPHSLLRPRNIRSSRHGGDHDIGRSIIEKALTAHPIGHIRSLSFLPARNIRSCKRGCGHLDQQGQSCKVSSS